MSRRIRSIKSSQQIKEEKINFLLEDAEKNLVEYEKILPNTKVSCNSVVRENQELKIYVEKIKLRYQPLSATTTAKIY